MKRQHRNKTAASTLPKMLTIVRHGEAMPKDVGLDDFERSLVRKGEKECASVSDAVRVQAAPFDLLLSSPADRALETAHIFADTWQYPVQKIKIVPEFYFKQDMQTFLAVIKTINSEYGSVAIFGHNPSFSSLASYLLPDFTEDMPKGSAIGISFDITEWNRIKRGSGTLRFFITPRKVELQQKFIGSRPQQVVEQYS